MPSFRLAWYGQPAVSLDSNSLAKTEHERVIPFRCYPASGRCTIRGLPACLLHVNKLSQRSCSSIAEVRGPSAVGGREERLKFHDTALGHGWAMRVTLYKDAVALCVTETCFVQLAH